jgi:hypothetical protein
MPVFSCVPSTVVEAQGQCPVGYAEAAGQVFVAFEAEPPSADVASSLFVLGFVAAFAGARLVSMFIRAAIEFAKS